jgi:hypothetical protein
MTNREDYATWTLNLWLDNMALADDSIRALQFSSVITIPPSLYIHISFIYRRGYKVLAIYATLL